MATATVTLASNTAAGLYAGATGTGRLDDAYTARPAGAVTTTAYDADGNALWALDPAGARTATTYTADGEPDVVTLADGSTKTFGFDRDHLRTSVTDGLSNATTWAYDDAGRLASETAPGKPAATVAYATGSYPSTPDTVTTTRASGGTVTRAFDEAGRLASVDYSGTTPDVTAIGYDHDGRRTSMTTSGASTSTWSWDDLGRLRSSTRDGRTVGYDYDIAGNLTTLTYPGSRDVTYGYDDASRLTSLDDWANAPITFALKRPGSGDCSFS